VRKGGNGFLYEEIKLETPSNPNGSIKSREKRDVKKGRQFKELSTCRSGIGEGA